jgi:membrane protease YdiL (CAAX protease family)
VSDVPATARSPNRLAGWLALVGVLVALGYGSRAGGAEIERDLLYRWITSVATLVQFGLMLLIVLWIVRRGPARELLALRQPRSWRAAAGRMFALFVGVFVLAAALDPVLHAGEEQGLAPEGWDGSRALPFVANFVLVAGFVPIVEELTFRGAGYAVLERFGVPAAIIGTGLLFGLAHGLVRALPILVAFGVGLAWLRYRSNSVVPCIVVHAIFNAISLLAAVTLEGNNGS